MSRARKKPAPKNIVARRPAEAGGAFGATITVLLLAFGIDPKIAAAIGAASGYAPAAITWLVTLIRTG